MKIAVDNINNIQETEDGKLRFYFAVPNDYDFGINEAKDVTNLESLKLFLKYNRLNYISFRDSCKVNLLPLWDELSDDDKKYLISRYIYPASLTQEDIDILFNGEQQLDNWGDLYDISYPSRVQKWIAAKKKVSFMMNKLDVGDLFISVELLWGRYTEANRPDLICWVTNTAYPPLGIDYTTNGFAQKPYYSDAVKNAIVDIIINGK